MAFPECLTAIRSRIREFGHRKAPAALAVASALWPSSSELFAEDFLYRFLDEDSNELGNLLAQIEAFSESMNSGAADLFKFRELLLEAAHSVFMRWKVVHQLRTMALTDELTNLYNRRGFYFSDCTISVWLIRNSPTDFSLFAT